MNKNSLAHTRWECKYHIVFAPKYRRKVIYQIRQNEESISAREESDTTERSDSQGATISAFAGD